MNLSARKEPEVKLEHTSMATQIKHGMMSTP
jgi:hypothetical protein